jgi:hypothetical protein
MMELGTFRSLEDARARIAHQRIKQALGALTISTDTAKVRACLWVALEVGLTMPQEQREQAAEDAFRLAEQLAAPGEG